MNDKIHNFDVEDAIKYGVNRAIVLYTMKNWIDYKARNKKGLHEAEDGKRYYFAYASAPALCEKIPYLSRSSINDALNYFVEKGILIKGRFNKLKWDKTSWYADASQPVRPMDIDCQNPVIDAVKPVIGVEESDNNTISHDISKDTTNIATSVAEGKKKDKDDEVPMALPEFYEWTKKSSQRAIRVIGEWADTIKPNLTTKGQWRVFMSRHLRAAQDVAKFSDKQIENAYDRILQLQKKNDFTPTLETLKKYLTN